MSKLRSYAPAFIKQVVWNWKHSNNDTDPEKCPHDLLECLHTLEPNARILDLGCGPGNLRAALRLRGWNGHFVGVDVSMGAIERARKSGDNNAEWHVSAIEDYPPFGEKFDTICFCESIYYVKLGSIPALLGRCRRSLASRNGRIVIRICHADRHREYVALLTALGAKSTPPIYTLCA